MAREVGAVNDSVGPTEFVIVIAVAMVLPFLVFSLPQHLIQGRHPAVIGSYRGCDLVRGYDKERGESFYFADCGPDRIGTRNPPPLIQKQHGD